MPMPQLASTILSFVFVTGLLTPSPLPAQAPSASPGAGSEAVTPRSNPSLRSQLLTMLQQDQTARGLAGAQSSSTGPAVASNLAEIDAVLTKQLKDIVAQHGWPTIALVGPDASKAATLLLGHTADLTWRKSLMPQLTTLADRREIDPAQLAIVIDKQLVADGRPQRYGTQFRMLDGEIAMITVEDPGGLDNLRARALLPTLDAYKQTLARMYHLKVSNKIASPPTPATTTTPVAQ